MNKLNLIAAVIATASFFVSCDNGKTEISGVATGTDQLTLIEVQGENLDTLEVFNLTGEEAAFEKELMVDSLSMMFLYASDQLNVPLIVQPGDDIELTIDATTPPGTYEVSGSYESERVQKITEITRKVSDKVDSLSTLLRNAQDSAAFAGIRAELDSAYEGIVANATEKFKAMIDEDPGSMANIFIFSQAVGNRPIISVEEDFQYLDTVASALSRKYPGHTITKNFNRNVDQVRQQVSQSQKMQEVQKSVSTGKQVPEISLPNPQGETMNLSDLRGQVVLVDFWAAWCKPCRIENPNLVRMYNEYKDQGFTVYSVSLDGLPQQQNPKEQWVQAIEQDNLTWDTHVSDLQGWNSSVVPKFGFQGIPYTVLVDRDGTIIETNLRGPKLEAKLKEVLREG